LAGSLDEHEAKANNMVALMAAILMAFLVTFGGAAGLSPRLIALIDALPTFT
jgi:hypothetical protein